MIQSALDTAGPQAAQVATLWWWLLAILGAVWLAVLVVLAAALAARHRDPTPDGTRRRGRLVAAAAVASVVILFVCVFCDVSTGRGLTRLATRADTLELEITGHQFWRQVEYVESTPSNRVTTANEIHLPVGRPVAVRLRSADVIHSLWIPSLTGKRDLIPGRESTLVFEADRPGVYRGQCAELCGLQHANMAIVVVAEEPARFQQWLDLQRHAPPGPTTDAQKHGHDLFVHGPCALCHTIAGTDAAARRGPDLSHVASRLTLAAGTVPNRRGYLAGWIIDPQHTKPGTEMPAFSLAGPDLQDLLAYLETLE
jgi:cytochrome c oxidase subunit 2